MQQSLLLTPYQIRQELDDAYLFIQRCDPKRKFRRSQNRLRNILKEEARCDRLSCALCGSKPISVAHIESLEEGGCNNSNNLIPLCKACHDAFDSGHVSQNEIHKVRESWPTTDGSWLKQKMKDRQEMLAKDRSSESTLASTIKEQEAIQKLIKEAQYDNAETRIKELKGSFELKCWLGVRLVEVNRRRGKCGKLEEAVHLADELSKDRIASEYASDLYYQAGYANLEFGDHARALEFFGKSLKALPQRETWKHVATRMLILQATVAGRQDTEWSQAEVELQNLKELIRTLQGASQNNEAERRWQHNYALGGVRFYLARGRDGDLELASSSWSQASRLWADMTLETGWQRESRSTIGYVKGCLMAAKLEKRKNVQREELERALGALARGTVLLIGKGWNFPQESRDLLFATGDVLQACGEKQHAKKVRDVAKRIREGCSWKTPHRVDSLPQRV